jgi:hypothetical protein
MMYHKNVLTNAWIQNYNTGLTGVSSRFWISVASYFCKCETRCNSLACYNEILCQEVVNLNKVHFSGI